MRTKGMVGAIWSGGHVEWVMSGARVVKVDGEEVKEEVKWLNDVLCTCYGPWGNQILLHSDTGGVVTLTKSSLKLLRLLKAKNTLTSTIISHLQGHAQCYRDSTLHTGILTCKLVLQGLELQMPRRKVAVVINHTLSLVVDWLGGACPVKHELDMCSAQQLKALLTSYLAPKMSMLSQQELQHLSSLILKAFLRALPSEIGKGVNMSEHLHLLSAPPTLHTQQSSLHEGLLLPQDMWSSPLTCSGFHGVLTLLFDISLAGGPSEGSEFTVVGVASVDMDAVLEEELMSIGRGLVERGVGLVACQKCVHPALQDYLNKKGVLVVERLGSSLFPMMHGLCGGSVISSLDLCAISHARLGTVTQVRPVQEHGQTYVCLQGPSDANSTLFLCCNTERQLDELRPLVENAGRVLESCAGDPAVLCGGGCGNTNTAHYIRMKAAECAVSDAVVMEMVAQCFEELALSLNTHGAMALTDSFSHHCWFFPPVDGHSQQQLHDGAMACNCGSILVNEVPADSNWSVLGTTDISTVTPFLQHLKWCSQHHGSPTGDTPGSTGGPPINRISSSPSTGSPPSGSPLICRHPHVFDLLTPRIAALGCASDLSEIALTTAFIVTHNNL